MSILLVITMGTHKGSKIIVKVVIGPFKGQNCFKIAIYYVLVSKLPSMIRLVNVKLNMSKFK